MNVSLLCLLCVFACLPLSCEPANPRELVEQEKALVALGKIGHVLDLEMDSMRFQTAPRKSRAASSVDGEAKETPASEDAGEGTSSSIEQSDEEDSDGDHDADAVEVAGADEGNLPDANRTNATISSSDEPKVGATTALTIQQANASKPSELTEAVDATATEDSNTTDAIDTNVTESSIDASNETLPVQESNVSSLTGNQEVVDSSDEENGNTSDVIDQNATSSVEGGLQVGNASTNVTDMNVTNSTSPSVEEEDPVDVQDDEDNEPQIDADPGDEIDVRKETSDTMTKIKNFAAKTGRHVFAGLEHIKKKMNLFKQHPSRGTMQSTAGSTGPSGGAETEKRSPPSMPASAAGTGGRPHGNTPVASTGPHGAGGGRKKSHLRKTKKHGKSVRSGGGNIVEKAEPTNVAAPGSSSTSSTSLVAGDDESV